MRGVFQPEIGSFWLHRAAEGKAARTVRTYTEAVQWFGAHLIPHTFRNRWEQVDGQDMQRWLVHLLAATATPMAATSTGRCSSSSNGSRRRSSSRTRWPWSGDPVLSLAGPSCLESVMSSPFRSLT